VKSVDVVDPLRVRLLGEDLIGGRKARGLMAGNDTGGPGTLMGGVTGVAPARILVIGGGVVGTGAARIALGAEGEVTILERSLPRLHELDEYFGARARILMSDAIILEDALREADVVIGAVLVPGALAPQLVTREMLGLMKPRSVIVDVAIDQGGCVETIHATTHENPTYVVDGIIHYGVANMPGGVPRTSTLALTNATFPYAKELAKKGWKQALKENEALRKGLNIVDGKVTYPAVAEAFALPYTPPDSYLN
jgi:alanine dehydrogenase